MQVVLKGENIIILFIRRTFHKNSNQREVTLALLEHSANIHTGLIFSLSLEVSARYLRVRGSIFILAEKKNQFSSCLQIIEGVEQKI